MLVGCFEVKLDWLFVFCADFDWLVVSSTGYEYFDHGDEEFFLKHGAEPWRRAIFNLGIIWCFVSILCEPLDDHGGEVVFWVFGNFNFSSKLL